MSLKTVCTISSPHLIAKSIATVVLVDVRKPNQTLFAKSCANIYLGILGMESNQVTGRWSSLVKIPP